MQVTEKIAAFRARMKDENFAAVIVPTADSHASEYIADYYDGSYEMFEANFPYDD